MIGIILAGGKGSRMAPFTEPKCLMELGDKPIIRHIIDQLAPHVSTIVVCTGYRWFYVEGELHDALNVSFSRMNGNTTQAQRLLAASGVWLDRAIVCYGDEYAEVEIPKLIADHETYRKSVTMTVMRLKSQFGVVECRGDYNYKFTEKPLLPQWFNIGYQVWEREAFSELRDGEDLPAFFTRMAEDCKMAVHVFTGKRVTFNSVKELEEARAEWAK